MYKPLTLLSGEIKTFVEILQHCLRLQVIVKFGGQEKLDTHAAGKSVFIYTEAQRH